MHSLPHVTGQIQRQRALERLARAHRILSSEARLSQLRPQVASQRPASQQPLQRACRQAIAVLCGIQPYHRFDRPWGLTAALHRVQKGRPRLVVPPLSGIDVHLSQVWLYAAGTARHDLRVGIKRGAVPALRRQRIAALHGGYRFLICGEQSQEQDYDPQEAD